MRKPNQIRREFVVACVGLMLGFGGGGFSNLSAAGFEAGTQAQNARNFDYGFVVQQPESVPRKIEGDWEGTLDAGAAKLRLVLHVVRKDGALEATLDSPDQGATGLPIDSITLSSSAVRF